MKLARTLMLVTALALVSAVALAEDRGTREEAEALVKKAVEYIKTNGAEKAYAEFDKRPGPFVDRDLYVMVYDLTGRCLAHGQSPVLIGKDLTSVTDPDGKAFIKERVDLAKTKDSFWQDYRFKDPVTKTIQSKKAYCEKLAETVVCSGVYKMK